MVQSLLRWLSLLWLLVSIHVPTASPVTPSLTRPQLQRALNALVAREDEATLTGNREMLESVMLPHSKTADAVYQKARQRMAYIQDWSRARQIRFDQVGVHVRIGATQWLSPTEVRVYGADQAHYQYHHLNGSHGENWFGLGVYHWYVLAEFDGSWYIKDDTFIDPLNQDTRLGGAAVPAVVRVKPDYRVEGPPSAGAERALQYAREYCGAAPGCGHDNQYHPDYADYNWNGGDCTNFISQVLHAGGFAENSTWSGRGGGTDAWVNAIRLSQYLQRSRRATVYASGTLPALIAPEGAGGPSALDRLRVGDLIAYWERGRVVHFAIVAGFDTNGYPLVISHSADRCREPWDLGWDRSTRYLFFHVHYPS